MDVPHPLLTSFHPDIYPCLFTHLGIPCRCGTSAGSACLSLHIVGSVASLVLEWMPDNSRWMIDDQRRPIRTH